MNEKALLQKLKKAIDKYSFKISRMVDVQDMHSNPFTRLEATHKLSVLEDINRDLLDMLKEFES